MKKHRNKRITDYEIYCTNPDRKFNLNIKIKKILSIHLNDCIRYCENYYEGFPFCWDLYLKKLVKNEMIMNGLEFNENEYYKTIEKFFKQKDFYVYSMIHQYRISKFINKKPIKEIVSIREIIINDN